jgi:hypothetical protein
MENVTTEAIVGNHLWQMIEVTSQERACAVASHADKISSDPVASRETCQLSRGKLWVGMVTLS